MRVLFCLIVCMCLQQYADGESAPFITPCHASDTACLKTSAQKAVPVLAAGVPSLGINTLDPMPVGRVATSQAGLDMDFNNTIVKGLRNCVVESLKRKGIKTLLELRCSVILTGDYTLGGRLLILPIEGKGKYKIKIRDIIVNISYDISERTEKGEKYWHLYNWQHSEYVKTLVEYHFQNLFNGNKQLADPIHEFANQNWKDIFQEVAPPIVNAIVSKLISEITKLFQHVPAAQLALV